jgi:acylphosphatase
MQDSSESIIRVQAIASGIVQGVSYRWFVVERAKELDIRGWVKNLPDGRVEAELEGRKDAVEKLIEAMKKGPSAAHVSGVSLIPLTYEGSYHDFRIRH